MVRVTGTVLGHLLTALTMSEAAFLSWGWRVPFLASVVLVGVGLFVRLRLVRDTRSTDLTEDPVAARV